MARHTSPARGAELCAVVSDQRPRRLRITFRTLFRAPHPVMAWDNKKAVLAALNEDGHNLLYACPELKADREVVLTAVKQNGRALQHATDELRADKTIVWFAVNREGSALFWASDSLKNDTEVVLAAVQQDGYALD